MIRAHPASISASAERRLRYDGRHGQAGGPRVTAQGEIPHLDGCGARPQRLRRVEILRQEAAGYGYTGPDRDLLVERAAASVSGALREVFGALGAADARGLENVS